ncbi:MAG: aromatic amino acid transport family protein [Patescibacteria group bacterium]
MNKGFFFATAILAGTIIGAGIFSLPYVVSRIGVLSGLFYLIIFALVYFAIHLMYARLVELEPSKHNFFYLAKNYLQKPWGEIASFVILAELILVLAVYLILAPNFIRLVFPLDLNLSIFIFWFVGSLFIFSTLNFLGWAELAGTLGIFAIILLVFFAGGTGPIKTPPFQSLDWKLFFLPFGPLLFSIAGRPAIHKVVETHRAEVIKSSGFSLRGAIFWGTMIPAIIYFLFVLGVLRLNPNVGVDTISSLNLTPELFTILGVLGFITLWTSYFMIGASVKDILRFDLKWSPIATAFVVLFLPLGLYFAGLENFFTAVGLTGGIFLALEGIFVISMWRKAFPTNRFRDFALPLYLVFLGAIVYEILNFVVKV